MKKRILFFMFLFSLVFLIANGNADIILTHVGGYNMVLGEGFTQPDSYRMYAFALTNNQDDIITVKGPGIDGIVQLTYLPRYDDLFSPNSFHLNFFDEPLPDDETDGEAWRGVYYFYVNGEDARTVTVYPDAINKLPVVGNPLISVGIHPTLTWEAVQGRSIMQYSVRIFEVLENGNPDYSALLYRSPNLYEEGRLNYSFTYQGDLFTKYDKLAIRINAVDRTVDTTPNDSNYFFLHSGDSDHDGIIDEWDQCPDTPADSCVNVNGCQASGYYTQEELNQAVAEAEAAKDVIIAARDLTINSQAMAIDSLVATLLKKSNADTNAADAVRTLAQDAIDQAIAEVGKAKEIEKAEKEMEKAQKELDHTKKDGTPDPKYDKAIDHYKKAWKHAQKAIK